MRFRSRIPHIGATAIYRASQTIGARIGRELVDPLPDDLAVAVTMLAMEYTRTECLT